MSDIRQDRQSLRAGQEQSNRPTPPRTRPQNRPQNGPQNPQPQESPNAIDEFLEWLENLDVPKMTPWQKFLVYGVCFILVLVVITSFTGHAYIAAVAFVNALDGLSVPLLTFLVLIVVAVFEIIGVNTTLMALAVGYIYGRRYSSTLDATIFATIVSFIGVCIGCMISYYLGSTVLLDWALELQRRNEVFEAIDHVLEEQGFKVNCLLRLTLPDCLINYSMGCSKCKLINFVGGFFAMIPWIAAHAWYGAQIESLTDKVGNDQEELVTLIIGIVATTMLSVILIVYTKKELRRMMDERRGRDEEAAVERDRPQPPRPAPEIEPRFALTSSETGYAGSTFRPANQGRGSEGGGGVTRETPEFEMLQQNINKNNTKPPPVSQRQTKPHQAKPKHKVRELSSGTGPRGAGKDF